MAETELLQGTLDMLVLRILAFGPMHGWGIAERIHAWSGQVFRVRQGSLYPALRRMERRGWVRSEWKMTENRRRARYYELTTLGRGQLAERREAWKTASAAVWRIMQMAH